jgi:hypothetical protein
MPTRQEAIAALAADDDLDGVVAELMQNARRLYTTINNKGYSAAQLAEKEKRTNLEATIERLEGEIKEARKNIGELEKKAPEAASLKQQYEQQVEQLKEQHKTAQSKLKDQLANERRQTVISTLTAKLVQAKVDPKYAKVIARDEDIIKRLKFNDDGTLDVMQQGKDIPVVPGENQDRLDVLVEDVVRETDPKFISADVDRGGGHKPDTSSGGNGSGSYDAIRERVKKEQDDRAKTGGGLARFGVRPGNA